MFNEIHGKVFVYWFRKCKYRKIFSSILYVLFKWNVTDFVSCWFAVFFLLSFFSFTIGPCHGYSRLMRREKSEGVRTSKREKKAWVKEREEWIRERKRWVHEWERREIDRDRTSEWVWGRREVEQKREKTLIEYIIA